jgi:hypothetical protein
MNFSAAYNNNIFLQSAQRGLAFGGDNGVHASNNSTLGKVVFYCIRFLI